MIFVRIGNVVEAYLLAVYSDHILTISEDHDVVLEIFCVKRVFLYKVRQLLLGYESGLLEKCWCVFEVFELVILEQMILKMEQQAFVNVEYPELNQYVTIKSSGH